jgi:copper(I)-binding protein
MDMKKLLFLCLLILTACAPAPQRKIEVSQATVRLLGGDMPAAGYLLIKNSGSLNDRLLSVDADFAAMTMLHHSSVDDSNVAHMEMVMAIDVPAGQQVELKPGGFHISLEGLKPGLKAGDTVTLTLQFEQAGAVSVQAQVVKQ